MKFLVVFAVLILAQTITAQKIKDDHQPDNVVQGHEGKHTVGHNTQVSQKAGPVLAQNVNHHVNKPTNQHSMNSSKVTVQIPSKVQQIVTQVTQHIPMVVEQHVAQQQNKQRMVRSLMNRLNSDVAEKPRKCVYECSPLDLTVCAYNGRCYQEFESQCEMSAYNCLNTQKKFHLVQDAECQDSSAVKCYPGDM